jgi:hypothetical protein
MTDKMVVHAVNVLIPEDSENMLRISVNNWVFMVKGRSGSIAAAVWDVVMKDL